MGKRSSSGKGLAVLALIIGASGLGLGIYSYIQIQTGVNGPDSSISIIVGLWLVTVKYIIVTMLT